MSPLRVINPLDAVPGHLRQRYMAGKISTAQLRDLTGHTLDHTDSPSDFGRPGKAEQLESVYYLPGESTAELRSRYGVDYNPLD